MFKLGKSISLMVFWIIQILKNAKKNYSIWYPQFKSLYTNF